MRPPLGTRRRREPQSRRGSALAYGTLRFSGAWRHHAHAQERARSENAFGTGSLGHAHREVTVPDALHHPGNVETLRLELLGHCEQAQQRITGSPRGFATRHSSRSEAQAHFGTSTPHICRELYIALPACHTTGACLRHQTYKKGLAFPGKSRNWVAGRQIECSLVSRE